LKAGGILGEEIRAVKIGQGGLGLRGRLRDGADEGNQPFSVERLNLYQRYLNFRISNLI